MRPSNVNRDSSLNSKARVEVSSVTATFVSTEPGMYFTLQRRGENAIPLWPVKGDRTVYAEKLLRIVLLLYGCQARQVFWAVPRLCAFITTGVIGVHGEATVAARLGEVVSSRSQEGVDGLVKTGILVETLKTPT